GALEARDPPAEAALQVRLPVIERVAPALAGFREDVGGEPGDGRGVAGLVEEEEFPIAPEVDAVVGDEDGDVADEADAAAAGVVVQGLPLAVEEELDEAVVVDLPGEGFARVRQRGRLSRAQRRVPPGPGGAAVFVRQGADEG